MDYINLNYSLFNKPFVLLIIFAIAISSSVAQLNYYKIYDRGYEEWAWDLESTHDEGFIIVGQTTENQDDIILIKTDYFGDTIWTKSIGGLSWDYGYSIKQTSDLGYIVAGQTASFGAGGFDIYLVKLNSDGEVIWSKTYGGMENDGGGHIQITVYSCDFGHLILV